MPELFVVCCAKTQEKMLFMQLDPFP